MLLHKRGGGRERDKRQYWPFLRQCREVSIPLCNCRQFLDTNLVRIAPSGALRNCFNLRYFTQEERGIGYSFQLAITAPLYSITGYCIATAQSCLFYGTISARTDDKRNNALRGWCSGAPLIHLAETQKNQARDWDSWNNQIIQGEHDKSVGGRLLKFY